MFQRVFLRSATTVCSVNGTDGTDKEECISTEFFLSYLIVVNFGKSFQANQNILHLKVYKFE